jgi:hypothetical protein
MAEDIEPNSVSGLLFTAFERALAIDPGHAAARTNLARARAVLRSRD